MFLIRLVQSVRERRRIQGLVARVLFRDAVPSAAAPLSEVLLSGGLTLSFTITH
jgi:hypothetical protein